MKTLLANAKIMDVNSKYHGETLDILVEEGVISAVGKGLEGRKVIDLKGKVVTPAFFDLFAHFNEPGFEHKENLASGVKSALFGGFSDVCLIPNTHPVIDSKSDVGFIRAGSTAGVDLHVIAAVSEGCLGENLTEILDLQDAGAVAFSDGLNPIWNTELLLKALQYVQKFDGLIMNRPKDVHLSQFTHMHEGGVSTTLGLKGDPGISEEIAIKRDLDILKYAGGRLHVSHLSTARGVNLIKSAKTKGLQVTADVAVNQLLYTDDDLMDYDSNLKSDPPFRGERDRKALIKGLKEGVIDAIISSHQPQDPESKELEFDLASPGIMSLPTLYSDLLTLQGELPLEIAVQKLTSGPRAVLGLSEVKVEAGSIAKLAVFDPSHIWGFTGKQNPSRSNNTPKYGKQLTGKCFGVYNQGHFFQNK
ncbi:dihydroorotase [Marinoscillum sp.]|uniref:dihydroorotase n=1 Tax=Marinoscillum sp. TaxID=2024838 RepID=UPI003BAD34EE